MRPRSLSLIVFLLAGLVASEVHGKPRPFRGRHFRDGLILQASVNNRARRFYGLFQLALHANRARGFYGLAQVGMFNYGRDVGAVGQLGIQNLAKNFVGAAQLGVHNKS